MLTLRAHHILCTLLFEGKGYSSSFTSSLAEIAHILKTDDPAVRIAAGYDDICVGCPNKDDADPRLCINQRVSQKDRDIIRFLRIQEGCVYKYSTLAMAVRHKITAELFISSCQNCIWFKDGVCSYDKLRFYADEIISTINETEENNHVIQRNTCNRA